VPTNRQPGEGIEEAARRQRLETWQKLGGETIPVFLGHHGDDALEDLFLKMARGANCSGLTGLRPFRSIAGVKLYRPLLAVRRQEIESYLLEHGVSDWRLDATNAENIFRRNAVRNQLLPLFRRIFDTDAGLKQCLRTLRQDADCLEAAAAAQNPVTPADWQALPEALRVRLLQRLLPTEVTVSHRTLTRLSSALERFSGVPLTVSINHDFALRLTHDNVRLVRTDAALTAMPPRSWPWQTCPALALPELGGELQATVSKPDETPAETRSPAADVVAFAAESVPPSLTIRTWQPGDRMTPFGATTAKKLQDIFTDARIPRDERHRLPIVLAGDKIIWVAGVRRAAWAPIRPETQRVVTLAWQCEN
ncbi:MAG TPA: tRNA lysidine(34) synthetase TilS, partial [Lentisphaeria bacterium]|nr:tRNA lysidine(34) synthetase TilS [Lentisphaeria bacterium]